MPMMTEERRPELIHELNKAWMSNDYVTMIAIATVLALGSDMGGNIARFQRLNNIG